MVNKKMAIQIKTTVYIEFTIGRYDQELDLEISGMVSSAIRAKQHRDGSWDAPEDACIDDLAVGYWSKGHVKRWNDFLPFLTDKQIELIEEKLYESAVE